MKEKTEIRIQNSEFSNTLTSDSRLLTSVPHGFTLIELLTVIAIIAILVGLTVGISKYAWTKSANSRAQAEIAAMELALEAYKADNGVYPPSTTNRGSATDNSGSLYTALTGGTKKYFDFKPNQTKNSGTFTYIQDPFGRPYNYFKTNDASLVTNVATFDLWSYGADPNNTNGWITNWK
jgi:prepilin-type N-terminal cleavage/methylation domain-containing protein